MLAVKRPFSGGVRRIHGVNGKEMPSVEREERARRAGRTGLGGQTRTGRPAAPRKTDGWNGKRTCKSMGQEVNHQKACDGRGQKTKWETRLEMKVLITGGAGFIGSHLVEFFQDQAEVRVLDNLRSGFRHNLKGMRCQLIHGSILDRDLVRRSVRGVDYVFHLAAMVSVPESLQKPVECAEVNGVGTLIVLEEAARAKARKLVLSSSAAIYGDNPVVPKRETMLPEPKSPYAITKLEGEFYCQLFAAAGRLPTVCLRYFNVFGPRQNPRSQYAAAIPIFIDHAVRSRPITIYGDGRQTRDFICVKDVVAANAFFATQSSASGIFNVACGKGISINQLAAMIRRMTGSASEISHAPERPGDVKYSVAAVDRLRAAGFVAAGDFREELRATIGFFQSSGARLPASANLSRSAKPRSGKSIRN
jgi:UDP-glucose 4-epimerase